MVGHCSVIGHWSMVGHGGDDFMFLFFQFDLGGSSWGHGSFVLFEVSSLDGGLGQDGIRVGEETALLALFGGSSGSGGGLVVQFEEFRTGSNNLLEIKWRPRLVWKDFEEIPFGSKVHIIA